MRTATSSALAGALMTAACSGTGAPQADPTSTPTTTPRSAPTMSPAPRSGILSPLDPASARTSLAAGAECVLRREGDALAILVAGDGMVLVDEERRRLTGVPVDAAELIGGGAFTAGDVALSIRPARELGEGDAAGRTSTKPVEVVVRQGARENRFVGALACSTGPDTTARPAPDAATTRDQQPKLSVEGAGLRWFLPPNGSARPIPFGTPQADVLASLEGVRGPAGRGINADCGAGRVEYANWPDGLSLVFQRGRFVGWGLDGRASGALSTADGVGPGTTRAELDRALATVTVRRTSLGSEFSAGPLHGVLDGAGARARVTDMWAGVSCVAR